MKFYYQFSFPFGVVCMCINNSQFGGNVDCVYVFCLHLLVHIVLCLALFPVCTSMKWSEYTHVMYVHVCTRVHSHVWSVCMFIYIFVRACNSIFGIFMLSVYHGFVQVLCVFLGGGERKKREGTQILRGCKQ